jgi:hypothetical protein
MSNMRWSGLLNKNMNKTEVLANLEFSRENFLDLIDSMSESTVNIPGVVGTWSIKDILAHLSRWEAELIKMLWEIQAGKKPNSIHFQPDLDVDQTNSEWHEEYKHRSYERILEDFHAVRNQTILRTEKFSERDLTDPKRFPWLNNKPLGIWIANDSFEHEKEHLKDIQAWLQRQKISTDKRGT